jgi:hypothetical protein
VRAPRRSSTCAGRGGRTPSPALARHTARLNRCLARARLGGGPRQRVVDEAAADAALALLEVDALGGPPDRDIPDASARSPWPVGLSTLAAP